jgi:hypothetical protein
VRKTVILHAFEENSTSARKEHISRYFGIAKDGNEDEHDDGSFIACYCGGRLVPMGINNEDQRVVAVWHGMVRGAAPIRDTTNGE